MTDYNFFKNFEERKNDPDSCERKPTADDIVVRVDSITSKMSMCLDDETYNMIELTSLRGYNNVSVPKAKWEAALKKLADLSKMA